MDNLASIAWPMVRLPEAIEVLARRAGMKPATNVPAVPLHLVKHSNQEEFESWLDWICARIGIEIEPVETAASDFSDMLRGAGPALLRHQHRGEPLILLLLKSTARYVQLIGPDLKVKRYPLHVVQAAICAEREKPIRAAVEGLIQHANISMKNRTDVIRFLIREQMVDQRQGGCWILRMPPTKPVWRQLTVVRLPQRILSMVTIFIVVYLIEIIGWMMIGQGALDGRLDYGWLAAWVLLLLMMVPVQFLGSWLQGMIAIDFGIMLKQRLLSGALRMDIDKVHRKGVGELLGYVIESQALESLALNGGFSVVIAAIELSLAAWVLVWGAGGLWHVVTLLIWVAGTLSVSWIYYQRLRRWTSTRITLTHDLIEQMVGHRTRIAQGLPDERHLREDQSLERFLHVSSDFDKAFVPLAWGAPRGWLIVGLLGLVPAFVWNKAEIMGLAVSLGGVLLAYRAFGEVGPGLAALARALVAGELIAPLWKTAQETEEAHMPSPVAQRRSKDSNGDATKSVAIQARDLIYRYGRQAEAVLKGCNLTIYHGDRLLLEGTSGSGKSTLAALLVGLRQPDSGLLMLNGLDQATLGQGWRRLSTAASQFHENHVMTGPFAFNLLMGRRWPPTVEDMAEAKQLCDELGLGDLLSRMPSGLMQIVGETGWQLSHGERSRLYLARALLQNAELVVLDESFAALDPETLTQCLRCALSRASTLVVIAHP